MVALARTYADDVEFSPEDATRTDPDFLVKVCEVAIEAGATTLNLPDTVGYCIPQDYAAMFRMVRARVPRIDADGIVLSAHCHDDLGLAVANSIAAIEAGVRQVECAVNGIGERAGNAALEEIAAILTVRNDKLPYTHNIVMNQLYPTSQMLAECISFGAAPNKAIVGANAFAHAAGIHQHGVMVNPLTYEIMTPESVGVSKSLARPRQTLRPPRPRTALRRTRPPPHPRRTRRRLPPLHRTRRPQKDHLRPGPHQPPPARKIPGARMEVLLAIHDRKCNCIVREEVVSPGVRECF
jgi:isopropylmalate/homocitrate/citramalate synthase